MKRAALCLFLSAAGLVPAAAQDAARNAAPVPPEFVALFSAWCLRGFPDGDAMTAQARRDKAHAMTARELGEFLYMGQGRGWAMMGKDGNYIVTDEQRPNRACTLRRYSDSVFDIAPMEDAVKRHVAQRGRKLATPQRQDRALTPRNGSHVTTYAELDGKGRPTGGRYSFERLSYGVGRDALGRPLVGFWEMRFTYQVGGRTI